jgi:hypothetical protein
LRHPRGVEFLTAEVGGATASGVNCVPILRTMIFSLL